MAHIGEVEEARFQDGEVEDEEERRRRKKEEKKKAKKEKRAKEEKEAAGGNIGYFVMRTPSVLDNSKQDDEDDYLTTYVHKPLKNEFENTTFGQNTRSSNQTQPMHLDKNSEVNNEGEVNKWRKIQEVRMKGGYSSEEEEGAQFFDSVSTPSSHQDKSMGVLYFDLCLSID